MPCTKHGRSRSERERRSRHREGSRHFPSQLAQSIKYGTLTKHCDKLGLVTFFGRYSMVTNNKFRRTLVMVVVLTCLIGCGLSKPSEQSLVDAFVEIEIMGNTLFFSHAERTGDQLWVCDGWFGEDVRDTISIQKLEITENDSDMFPYKGVVVSVRWSALSGGRTNTVSYKDVFYFGKRSNSWMREKDIKSF